MMLNVTKEDIRVIEEALMFLHGHYVNQATRCRSFSKKHINFQDVKKRDERIKEIRAKYNANATEVSEVLYKVDQQSKNQ